jgi:hypothetical protein
VVFCIAIDRCVAIEGRHVASILRFLRPRRDFDDALTKLMGEAFDAACRELHDRGQPPIVKEVMAQRILDAAKRGRKDDSEIAGDGQK